MRHVIAAILVAAAASAARAEITLLGATSLPASTKDKSGQEGDVIRNDRVTLVTVADKNGVMSAPIAANTFGGAGSAITYTGKDDLYLAATDRGPGDGDARYQCRVHLLRIKIDAAAAAPVKVEVEKTLLLKNEKDEPLVGASRMFFNGLRFDPEGIRIAPNGKDFFVSDEYGPYVCKFSADGKKIADIKLPEKFMIEQRSETGTQEISTNNSGRVSNKGMEGLAITPDGKKLLGLMQGPLLQDGALDAQLNRVGVNCRIVEIEIETGKTREFLYPMEDANYGNNEILAINDHAFLVIERDSKEGKKAAYKKLFRIDLEGATDISAVEKLPATGIPAGVKAVAKKEFLDFLDPKFKLAGKDFPDKLEGLAWGPDVAGKHTLIVTNDNDFRADMPNFYWVFAIPAEDLPGYVPQKMD